MAVPFSRPVYPGASRRRGQQAQTNPPPQHPITQFLEGRAPIRLDQLSLTSRIAFYALYEAYRLLVDLTQGESAPALPHIARHTVLNQRPSTEEVSNDNNLPDVVRESTQSPNPRGNDKCVTEEPTCNNRQPDVVIVDDEVDHAGSPRVSSINILPDFIPTSSTNKPESETRRTVSTSSDYFSLDGYPSDLDIEEDEDDNFDDKCTYKGVNWHNLGTQLCDIASAFEVTYSPALTEHQRQLYQVYRDLKLKTLALSRRDKTMAGLAKTVFRQVLLSSIWMLLKKIM